MGFPSVNPQAVTSLGDTFNRTNHLPHNFLAQDERGAKTEGTRKGPNRSVQVKAFWEGIKMGGRQVK